MAVAPWWIRGTEQAGGGQINRRPADAELVAISKFLCFILRHRPDKAGIALDGSGWARIAELIEPVPMHKGIELSPELLLRVVREDDKQRFAVDEDGLRIRAS